MISKEKDFRFFGLIEAQVFCYQKSIRIKALYCIISLSSDTSNIAKDINLKFFL